MDQKPTSKKENNLEDAGEKIIGEKDELIRFFKCLCTLEEQEDIQDGQSTKNSFH